MKNFMEQLKVTMVNGAEDYTSSKVLNAETDVRVYKGKLYDTSSDANDFAALVAGNVVKIVGFADFKTENNGIFKVVAIGPGGAWVQLDRPLVDVDEEDIPSGGITMEKTPASWTIAGLIPGKHEIMAVIDMSTTEAFNSQYFKVTANNTITSFANLAGDTDGDTVAVVWADLMAG